MSLTGCTKKAEIVGGYSNENSIVSDIPQSDKDIFAKTNLNGHVLYATLARQVVAGTNYIFLTKSDDKYYTIKVYKDLKGVVKVDDKKEFNYLPYLTKKINIQNSPILVGGYNADNECNLGNMPERLATATSGAFQDIKDVDLQAVCVLGSQVVAGTNYAMIIRGIPKDNNIAISLYVGEVYDGVNGETKLLSLEPLNSIDIK